MNVMAVVVVMPIIMGGKKSKRGSEKKRLADVEGKKGKTENAYHRWERNPE